MAGLDVSTLDSEHLELIEEAAGWPGARWDRCKRHPGLPTMLGDPRRCVFGCHIPETVGELVAKTPRSFRADLITTFPASCDAIVSELVRRGDSR
jgi:hypothetical protein